MAHAAVVSKNMPRPPKKPKKGEIHHMHILLPADLVEMIDRFAEKMGEGEQDAFSLRTDRTRSEATRTLIVDGLRKNGLIK
jgi:hypothetical protein